MLKGGGEDVEMGQCLQNVGVKAVHARDETGVTILYIHTSSDHVK